MSGDARPIGAWAHRDIFMFTPDLGRWQRRLSPGRDRATWRSRALSHPATANRTPGPAPPAFSPGRRRDCMNPPMRSPARHARLWHLAQDWRRATKSSRPGASTDLGVPSLERRQSRRNSHVQCHRARGPAQFEPAWHREPGDHHQSRPRAKTVGKWSLLRITSGCLGVIDALERRDRSATDLSSNLVLAGTVSWPYRRDHCTRPAGRLGQRRNRCQTNTFSAIGHLRLPTARIISTTDGPCHYWDHLSKNTPVSARRAGPPRPLGDA